MAISPSGVEGYQKSLLDKKVQEVVETLDKTIIEQAQTKLMEIVMVNYYEPNGKPLKKVCEEVCNQYLKNGWAWVCYKIENQRTEVGEYVVKYVLLTTDTRNIWGGLPESADYVMINKVKN